MAYVKWLIDWYYYVICCGVQYYTLPVPIRKKIRQRKSIRPASQIQILKQRWNTIYFRVSQIQIFFWKIAWGRGISCLLVRQERLLYLSTILRNKSVSKSLVYSFNITQTLYIAGWLLLWGFLPGWLHSELFPLKFSIKIPQFS